MIMVLKLVEEVLTKVMGEILIGTCSWTDPTLIESGRFYPTWARSAEARLQY